MSPEAVIAGGYTKTSAEIVQNRPKSGLKPQGSPNGSNAADDRNSSNKVDIQPVDMFVPIIPGNWSVGDMRLLAGFEFWTGRSWLGGRVNASGAHGES
jgi:hypothetical protein